MMKNATTQITKLIMSPPRPALIDIGILVSKCNTKQKTGCSYHLSDFETGRCYCCEQSFISFHISCIFVIDQIWSKSKLRLNFFFPFVSSFRSPCMPSHHVAHFLLHYSVQPFALIICTFCTKCNSIYRSIFYFCLLHNLYALFLYILTTVSMQKTMQQIWHHCVLSLK